MPPRIPPTTWLFGLATVSHLALPQLATVSRASQEEAPSAMATPGRPATPVFRRKESASSGVLALPRIGADGTLAWDYRVIGRERHGPRPRSSTGAGRQLDGRPPSPLPAPHEKALVNCFRNTAASGFFSTGTSGTEWIDWAGKRTGKTGLVERFVFAYGTLSRGSSEPGGTGAAIGLSFFTGTTGFCNRGERVDLPGDDDDVFDFTGLPGATGSQFAPLFTVTVMLPEGSVFCLPDGPVGWSYVFREPDEDPGRATGPQLTDFSANTSWSDAFDLWSRPTAIASCASTFDFGGCGPPTTFSVPPPCGGFFLSLWERTEFPASARVEHAGNRSGFRELGRPVLGAPWTVEIEIEDTNRNAAGLVLLGLGAAAEPAPLPPPGRGVLLVAPPFLLTDAARAEDVGGRRVSRHALELPPELGLAGTKFRAQGFAMREDRGRGKPHRLEALNALDALVGLP